MKTILFFLALLRVSIKASITRRGAFLVESVLLIASNLIFFFIWWVFFRQFNDVAGWNFNDMIVLMAVGTGGYGLMQICFGGVKNLAKIIQSGDLDPFMTQPKNLLVHVIGSKSLSKGWGHLMTSITLILLGGITTPFLISLILIGIFCACLVFTAVSIMAHSLGFWMGSIEGVSKKYCDALFLFALYPTNIYSGVLQVIMFTLIPAGIIGYLPVELMRNFTWIQLFVLIGSAFTFFTLAFFVFYAGLKKYESGNQFGTRL